MKQFFVSALVAALFSVSAPLSSAAQDYSEAHLELARKTMLATKSTQFFDRILPTLAEEVRDTFIRMDPGLTTVIEEKTLEAALELTDRRKELDDQFVRLWAGEFDADELKVISDFLTSETGEKFVNTSATITQSQARLAAEWSSELSSSFVSLVRQKLREAGYSL